MGGGGERDAARKWGPGTSIQRADTRNDAIKLVREYCVFRSFRSCSSSGWHTFKRIQHQVRQTWVQFRAREHTYDNSNDCSSSPPRRASNACGHLPVFVHICLGQVER
jgi:hypothetical protein